MLLTSVLVGAGSPAKAADQLIVRLDGFSLPIDIGQLEAWSRDPGSRSNDLGVWFELLDPRSRDDLRRLLRTPMLEERDLALQLIQSWAGRQVLEEMGALLSTDQSGSGVLLVNTLRGLLQRPEPVTPLSLLRAVPAPRLTLEVDEVLELAQQWRRQVERQGQALRQLRQLPLPLTFPPDAWPTPAHLPSGAVPRLRALALAVPHRPDPLQIELWEAVAPRRDAYVLVMPGLGSSGAQLSWLARGLAERGYPVLVINDPSSDDRVVRQLLDGQRPPPGAETLPARLADVEAVLKAEQDGQLPPLGSSAVLLGHSLGGLSALMAGGARPVAGLEQRCKRAMKGIPLNNLSWLLQCQLPEVPLPEVGSGDGRDPVAAVVSFNGFGSLLWPGRGLNRLNGTPLLMVGGGLDLVTPPVGEQLDLFLQHHNPRSRLVMVEGGSHFSVVRLGDDNPALLQLGQELVGVEPRQVQELLLNLTADFLASLDGSAALPSQQRLQGTVRAYVLDRAAARRWHRRVGG
ncbi:alpha/beta hydrolase [Synechococcus sp. ATX 2A4]|uniref:alpha/beta hydrolase family protein n=1 Tax=Synechococcus sp. ATX 2A4 TaxID=2823727 RepID=UPI0020CF557F|nr:alpha/beta hydrolase [Synechococcus sp. ATX 2A4]